MNKPDKPDGFEYVCDVCRKGYRVKRSLIHHIASEHADVGGEARTLAEGFEIMGMSDDDPEDEPEDRRRRFG